MLRHEEDFEPQQAVNAAPASISEPGLEMGRGVRAPFWRQRPSPVKPISYSGLAVIAIIALGLLIYTSVLRLTFFEGFVWFLIAPAASIGKVFRNLLRWVKFRRKASDINCSISYRLNGTNIGQDAGTITLEDGQIKFDGLASQFSLSPSNGVRVTVRKASESGRTNLIHDYEIAYDYKGTQGEVSVKCESRAARQALQTAMDSRSLSSSAASVTLPPVLVHDKNWVGRDQLSRHWRFIGIGAALGTAASLLLTGVGWIAPLAALAGWLAVGVYLARIYARQIRLQSAGGLLPESTVKGQQALEAEIQDDALPGSGGGWLP